MNEFTLALTVYGLLQVGSLVLLPRWWKGAALPSLYVMLPIWDYFRTGGGYMGDVFVIMFAIYACAWLCVVWVVFGIARLVRRRRIRKVATEKPKKETR